MIRLLAAIVRQHQKVSVPLPPKEEEEEEDVEKQLGEGSSEVPPTDPRKKLCMVYHVYVY
jgi:hypothetical protein